LNKFATQSPFRRSAFHALVVCAILATSTRGAEPAFTRAFDGPDTSWQLLETSTPARFLAHDCIAGGARDTRGIERIAVAAAAGQSVLLACPTPHFAAVEELQIRLWVKSNRPDIQLAARFVLPRSRHPQRPSESATVIARGAPYNRPGHWQQLVLTDVPKLLAAQVRILRATPGASIDAHEAYLDSVVLVIPGDPNGVELGTDQLEVDGVEVKPVVAAPASPRAKLSTAAAASSPPALISASSGRPSAAPQQPRRQPGSVKSPARLQGSMFLVNDRPFLPRVIQWSGEPLQFLADRGFNVVELPSPPNAEQIADAARYDLWFLSVPPRPDTITREGLGAEGDRVLAWHLQDKAIEADPNYAVRWAETVRQQDTVYGRPIILAPVAQWDAAHRAADIAIVRNPRASRMTEPEFQHWFAGCPALVRPGTPLWAGIHTQFGEAVRAQTNAFTRTDSPAPAVDAGQLQTLIHAACMTGAQGFEFQSNSPLSDPDPNTQRRAAVLELINRRLQLMEPWLAGGKVIGRINSTTGDVTAEVLYFDRARLLIPYQNPPKQKPGTTALARPKPPEIKFLVPGVPESSQVYFLTSASMRSVASQRVAGGASLSLPSVGDGLIVITEDPQVIQGLRQRINRHSAQTARLTRSLLVEQAQSIVDVDRRLSQLGAKPAISAAESAAINARLAQLDSLIAGNQLEQAQDLAADIATDFQLRIMIQQQAAGVSTGLQSNALGLNANRIADFVKLQQAFQNLNNGQNLLVSGDFENLGEMTQFGWQHIVHPEAGAQSHAELSTRQPQHGAYCLELQATKSTKPKTSSDEALVWIVSPPMPITQNATVEITGWVRVDRPFAEPGQGLAILDSLGGPELSLLVSQTSGWETFRMVRAVPQTGDLRLTFALNGTGSASVDAVMVRTLEQPVAHRLPNVPPQPPAPPTTASESMAEAPGPISRLPPPR